MTTNALAHAPRTDAVILSDYSARPGDAMTFRCHAPASVLDGERALVWQAPNGETIVTIGFIDQHPWCPVHKVTVLMCDDMGQPRSGQPQPGSTMGIIDHREAAESWWRLTAPRREKWQAALDVFEAMPVDDQHQPTLPITPELEGVLRLTLPWIPRPVWPEWCRRLYSIKAGMLAMGDGSRFPVAIEHPPLAMLDG